MNSRLPGGKTEHHHSPPTTHHSPLTANQESAMALAPLSIGVCSWSLQVGSIPELRKLMDRLGVNVVQIACGDPHHASWQEGDTMPEAAKVAGFQMTGAMLGFPGEDYTTPETIQKSGGFGN